jgi:hypothetical protein
VVHSGEIGTQVSIPGRDAPAVECAEAQAWAAPSSVPAAGVAVLPEEPDAAAVVALALFLAARSKFPDASVVASDVTLYGPYSPVYSSEPDEFQAKAELPYLLAAEQVPDDSNYQLVHSLRAARYFPDDLQEPAESRAVPPYFQADLPVRSC